MSNNFTGIERFGKVQKTAWSRTAKPFCKKYEFLEIRLFGQIGCDEQVFQLLFRNCRRRLRHQVLALLRFREGNDVANARAVCEYCNEPVKAESDAAVRRRAELERV